MSLPFSLVRTVTGVPTVENFANMDGTPIVIDDSTGDAYTLVAGVVTKILSSSYTTPAGVVMDFAGNSVPNGWLACDGSAVSRTAYANLFTAIGTTWGVGDGSTTFNLPDLRGRTTIGDGMGSGLTARTLGTQNIGEETHTMTLGELVAHTHTIDLYNTAGAGTHAELAQGAFATTETTSSTGSTTPFNVMQPSAVVKKIIKY